MVDLHLFDPKRAPYRWESYSRTAGEFGGDYAEAFPLPPDGLVALLSSNSEPGAAGAAWMMLTRSVYRLAAMSGKPPFEALLATHRLLARDAPGVSESAACARVDFQTRRVTWARAGDVTVLLAKGGGRVEDLPGTSSPLGTEDAAREVTDAETAWEPGDVLVLSGAGTARVVNIAGEAFGAKGLSAAVASAPRTARETLAWLAEALDRHAGAAPRAHDVSLLAVELGEAR